MKAYKVAGDQRRGVRNTDQFFNNSEYYFDPETGLVYKVDSLPFVFRTIAFQCENPELVRIPVKLENLSRQLREEIRSRLMLLLESDEADLEAEHLGSAWEASEAKRNQSSSCRATGEKDCDVDDAEGVS